MFKIFQEYRAIAQHGIEFLRQANWDIFLIGYRYLIRVSGATNLGDLALHPNGVSYNFDVF